MYAKNRRVGEPAIYNANRLLERPIPQLIPPVESDVSGGEDELDFNLDAIFEASIEAPEVQNNDNVSTVHSSVAGSVVTGDPLADLSNDFERRQGEMQAEQRTYQVDITFIAEAENGNSDGIQLSIQQNDNGISTTDETAEPSNGSDDQVDSCCVKFETVLIVKPSSGIMNNLIEMIEEPEYTVYEVDGMEMKVQNNKGFGKPFDSTNEILRKREGDAVSGDMPFNKKVYFCTFSVFYAFIHIFISFHFSSQKSGSRLYQLGKYALEVPQELLSTFKEWNSRHDKQNEEYDKRFIQALVLLCKNIEDVPMDSIETHISAFIRSLILVRANGDENRVVFMEDAMKNVMTDNLAEN